MWSVTVIVDDEPNYSMTFHATKADSETLYFTLSMSMDLGGMPLVQVSLNDSDSKTIATLKR